MPYRRTMENSQPHWTGELWTRSLRKPGMPIEDPFFANVGGAGGARLRELHEEWQDREQRAERDFGQIAARVVPFCGATTSGKAAMPRDRDVSDWVERPVATGKFALNHMEGQRYLWESDTHAPRFYEEAFRGTAPPPWEVQTPRQAAGCTQRSSVWRQAPRRPTPSTEAIQRNVTPRLSKSLDAGRVVAFFT